MRRRKDERRGIPIKFEESGKEAPEVAEQPSPSEQGEDNQAEEQPAVTPEAISEEKPAESSEASEARPAAEVASSDLQVQVDTLTAEKSALFDQLLRRQAEFENYRRRIERERSELFQRARADVLLEMLPVLDNLERALTSLEQSEGDEDALRHGVELIHRQRQPVIAS